jgi:hypothetical protein
VAPDTEGALASQALLQGTTPLLAHGLEPSEEDHVGPVEGLRSFAKPARGKRLVLEIADVEANDVEVPLQTQVLESVVQNVNASTEARLDLPSDDVTPPTHGDDDAG